MALETVKLGLMPPLTGLVGIYGTEISRAGQIACQEINENGGVLGRPLELVIEDDGSMPESAVIAATRLVEHHQCTAIIGNLLSNSRIAVAYSVAEPHKIPFLNFSFYEGSILSRYFFHFAALPNQQIDRMIPYMHKNFGPRMFFAGNNYEWPRGSIDAAKLSLEKLGGQVVGEEYCPIGVDLEVIERLLDQVEEANPDVFVPYFAGADQVSLLTRFTERGLKQRMAVVMGHYDELMASKLTPQVREDFYSSNTYFMTIDTPQNHSYLARLANMPGVSGIWPHGNGILTNFGEGTYVCVKAFAQAANEAGSLDAEALVDALKTIRLSAPQGQIQMDPIHHHAKVNTYLSQCRNDGKFEIVEEFGQIEPVLPERYEHQQIKSIATLEDDFRLQSRMLEQMSDAVFLVDSQNGKILFANPGADRMFAYDKGGLLDRPVKKLNHDQQASDQVFDILKQKGEWVGELKAIKNGGEVFCCSISVSTFTHPNPTYGEVWLWVASDITQRKMAEMELKEQRDFEKNLLDTAPAIVLLLDMQGMIQHVNSYFEKLSGYFLHEIQGKEWFATFFPEHEQDNIRQLFLKATHEESTTGNINSIVTRSGEMREIEWHDQLMHGSDGNISGLLAVGLDVTERRQVEAALLASEERYKRVERGTNDGLWEWNVVTGYDYFSPRWLEMLGYQPGELPYVVDTFVSLIHPDDVERVGQAITSHLENQKNFDVEMRLRHKDGSYIWVLSRGQAERNASGQPLIMAGTIIDITDRKITEQTLRSQATIIDQIHDSVVSADLEGFVTSWNKGAEKIFGYTQNEMLGRHIANTFPEDQQMFLQKEIIEPLQEKDDHEVEITLRRKSGEHFFAHLSLTKQYDDDNNVIGMIAYTMDISQRKQAEQALHSAMELNEQVINSSPIGIAIYDKTGQCIAANGSIADIVGATREQVLAQNYNNTKSWHESGLISEVEQALAQGQRRRGEFFVETSFEKKLTIDAQFVPFYKDSAQHLLLLVDDITERKNFEKELDRYRLNLEERVEERTKALRDTQDELVRKGRLATLGQLTATVSHELRNPLGAMRPSLYVIDKAVDKSDDRVQRAIERLDRNISRCDNIIDELLDFTRIIDLKKYSINIDKWLETLLQEQNIQAGIDVTTNFTLGEFETELDTDRLQRAIINVIDNACQAMEHENTRIPKENSHLHIETRQTEDRIELRFSDTGVGMNKNILEKIFEPLFSTKGFGVGLGMPQVKQIMEQHGGGIDIETEEGKGTTMILWLPQNIALSDYEDIAV